MISVALKANKHYLISVWINSIWVKFSFIILLLAFKFNFILVTWRQVLSKNTDSIYEPYLWTTESSSEPAHQVGLWTCFDFLILDYFWRWDVERTHFHLVLQDWCFRYLNIRRARFITPGGDRNTQNVTKVMSNRAETRS